MATFLIFVDISFKSMVSVLSIVVLIVVLSLAAFQAFKNHRAASGYDVRARVMQRTLCFAAMMFSCGLACGVGTPFRLIFDLSISIMAMYVPVLSIIPSDRIMPYSRISWGIMILVSIHYLLCSFGLYALVPDGIYLSLAGIMAVISAVMFMFMIWRRIRDVKSVIKSGNVWAFVTLCVDIIYVSVPLVILLLLQSAIAMFPGAVRAAYLVVLLLMSEVIALGLKMLFD